MRNSLFLLFTTMILFVSAQNLQVKEKLSYSVDYGGESYDFTLKIQQLSPEIHFDYALISANPVFGTIQIKKKAQQSAVKMKNNFSADDVNLTLQEEISVFPSQLMLDALINGKEIKMDAGNGMKVFQAGKTKSHEITIISAENGKVQEITKKLNVSELVSKDGANHIWISKDLGQAIIVEMDLGWKIQLKSWVLPMPLTDKPQDLIGKTMTSAEAQTLASRLAKSSYIVIEDLSDPDRPYLEKEYFCPMEGIRIKTHNDSLTTILFYTEGYKHEDYIWRAYDGKFASGINLKMTYAEVDKAIGKPETPRWATDVMILYPQQKMIAYYEMPDNEKDTKAISNAKINFIEFQ